MPKVTDDYFQLKRNQILDAAYAVYMRKPLYEVKMKDIIAETGLSQGGIYRYFANLDDILYALLNREAQLNIKDQVDKVLDQMSSPETIISDMFALMEQSFIEHIQGYGKIYFELAAVFANDPQRFEDFRSKVNLTSDMEYLQKKIFSYIQLKVQDGYFAPKLPLEDIFLLLIASIDGIERDIIFARCYDFGSVAPVIAKMDAARLIKSLCTSLLLLLNGEQPI